MFSMKPVPITLKSANIYHTLEKHMKENNRNFLEIELENDTGFMTLEENNYSFPKGKYMVKLFPKSSKFLVKQSESFPKYYFDFDRALEAIDEFLFSKKINAMSIRSARKIY